MDALYIKFVGQVLIYTAAKLSKIANDTSARA